MNNGSFSLPSGIPLKRPLMAGKAPPQGWTDYVAYLTAGTFTFTVPENVYQIALHVNGGGANGTTAESGGGGGFAYGVLDVYPNQVIRGIVVGGVGGTSSVAGLLTATGATGKTGGSGSIVTGSKLRLTEVFSGGSGADTANPNYPGGGGAGSRYGNGGSATGVSAGARGAGGGTGNNSAFGGAGAIFTVNDQGQNTAAAGTGTSSSNQLNRSGSSPTGGFIALVNKTLSGAGGSGSYATHTGISYSFGGDGGDGGGGGGAFGVSGANSGIVYGGNGGILGGGGGARGGTGVVAYGGQGGFLGGGGGAINVGQGGSGGNGGGGGSGNTTGGSGGQGAILIFWTPGY